MVHHSIGRGFEHYDVKEFYKKGEQIGKKIIRIRID
jgi:hypothetical protein